MHDAVEVRRREDGSIDIGHYADDAARLRLSAIGEAGRWLRASIRAWIEGGRSTQVAEMRRLTS